MKKKLLNGVSIVMPALNEELNIRQSINLVLKVFRDLSVNYELILINDGSKDNTGIICDEFSSTFKNITSIHHDKPQGMGSSYKEALHLAKME